MPLTGIRYSDDPAKYQREWMRQKRATDPAFLERERAASRKWQKNNPIRGSWNNARQSARKRGYDWALSEEEYRALVASDCFYCGAAPNPINGVDRVDNAIGYRPDNVCTACVHCNFAKRGMTRDQFIAWARRLVSHQEKTE